MIINIVYCITNIASMDLKHGLSCDILSLYDMVSVCHMDVTLGLTPDSSTVIISSKIYAKPEISLICYFRVLENGSTYSSKYNNMLF